MIIRKKPDIASSEITPKSVFPGVCEAHLTWVSAIDIPLIRAKRRHLKMVAVLHHQHNTKFCAHRHGLIEYLLHLNGCGGTGDVKILGSFFEKQISNAPADEIGLVAVCF